MATTELEFRGHAAPAPAPHMEHSGVMDWVTTTDHKKIGLLYIVTACIYFLIGGLLSLVIRSELVQPGLQFLTTSRYNEVFTMHGTLMIYLFSVPIFTGFANYIMPLQIGAADVAFPRLNAMSYWLFLFGSLVVMSSFLVSGGPAAAGWTAYPTLSLAKFLPGQGMDLWTLGLFLTGISSVIGAVNLIATVLNMRMPGLTMFRLPLFSWGIIVTQVLILFVFPIFAAGLAMLYLERHFGAVFFDASRGGNPVLWQHIFWFFGHPEVYIVAMPGFGIISEIIPVFSRKPMFGYRAMVFAFFAIAALSFSVWAHHMFATGAVNLPWFSGMTMLIAVPTGIKFFNWIGTMWRGSISFKSPMLFAVGFLFIFLIGGITGVFLASPPIDFQVTDTYYVVAHFHYVMLAALEFAMFGGIHFWYPKFTGRMLSERLGQASFWLLFFGFNLTFFPQFIAGLNGMPRRIADYDPTYGFTLMNVLSTIGAFMLGASVLPLLWNVIHSRKHGPLAGDDPWEGNSLEWATTSPPPHHNFFELPAIHSERPVFDKRHGLDFAGAGGHTDPQTKDRG